MMGAYGAAIAMAGAVSVGHMTGLAFVRRELGFWTVPTSWGDVKAIRERPVTEKQRAATHDE
jgi:hypothetical protein